MIDGSNPPAAGMVMMVVMGLSTTTTSGLVVINKLAGADRACQPGSAANSLAIAGGGLGDAGLLVPVAWCLIIGKK